MNQLPPEAVWMIGCRMGKKRGRDGTAFPSWKKKEQTNNSSAPKVGKEGRGGRSRIPNIFNKKKRRPRTAFEKMDLRTGRKGWKIIPGGELSLEPQEELERRGRKKQAGAFFCEREHYSIFLLKKGGEGRRGLYLRKNDRMRCQGKKKMGGKACARSRWENEGLGQPGERGTGERRQKKT